MVAEMGIGIYLFDERKRCVQDNAQEHQDPTVGVKAVDTRCLGA